MKPRTFRVGLPYTNNNLYLGDFLSTNRSAYCRGCGRVIPKGVLKYSNMVSHWYGRKGAKLVKFSYCLICSEELIKVEIDECKKHIKVIRKLLKGVTKEDREHSTKMMADIELINDI